MVEKGQDRYRSEGHTGMCVKAGVDAAAEVIRKTDKNGVLVVYWSTEESCSNLFTNLIGDPPEDLDVRLFNRVQRIWQAEQFDSNCVIDWANDVGHVRLVTGVEVHFAYEGMGSTFSSRLEVLEAFAQGTRDYDKSYTKEVLAIISQVG